MEGTTESDIPQRADNALDPDSICVDNNVLPNSDINVKCPIVTQSLPKKDIADGGGKPDEQLLDFMVLDDDTLNQIPSAIKLTSEESVKIENKVSIVEELSDETLKKDVKAELEVFKTEDVDNSKNKELKQPIAKAPESDSLILTADDELETEMFLPEKDKHEKLDTASVGLISENNKKIEPERTDEVAKEVVCTDNCVINANNDKKVVSVEHGSCKTESKTAHTFGSRFLWVSNITQSIKATELKQFISKVGKVITAKIVTDGKKCYGYVVMDNFEDASECLKVLNNTVFEGRKITVSFSRPATSNADKNKDSSTANDNDKSKPKLNNETDDTKSIDRRCVHSTSRKTQESSKTRRRSSKDPLTTKFENRDRFYRRRKSHSVERCSTDFLRDKLERDRLRRRILEEQRRSRDEMARAMHREEKQRELEFKLERERKKLQLERELFERERRELHRLDAERRKIEKERFEVMQERSKLEKEYQKSRSTRKNDEFNLSSTIVKPQESLKVFEKPKSKGRCDSNFRKIDNKQDRVLSNSLKNAGPLAHRIGLKDDFKLGKENRERSKSRRGEDLKDYERSIPPPPTLSNDFDLSTGRKLKHQDFKRDVHEDRKVDHNTGRKIDVIDRKYYSDRSGENNDRKNENVYRKSDFDDRKPYSFTERKYDYGRDPKRSRVGEFPVREPTIRNQWVPTTTYTEPWKTGLSTGVSNSPVRYQDGNFTTPSYGAANRVPPVYYHSGPSTQEYQRYDQCSQNNGRKY